MSELVNIYTVVFALLVFLTSKFSEHLDEAYDYLKENYQEIKEGKIKKSFVLSAFLGKVFYTALLISAYILNASLLYQELGLPVMNLKLKMLTVIVSVMVFSVPTIRLLAIANIISRAYSKTIERKTTKLIIDLEEWS